MALSETEIFDFNPQNSSTAGEIGNIISDRISAYHQLGNSSQVRHYSGFLADYEGRVNQGMEDPLHLPLATSERRFTRQVLPDIEDPNDRDVAHRVNAVFGPLDDDTKLLTIFYSDEWCLLREQLDRKANSYVTTCFNRLGWALFRIRNMVRDHRGYINPDNIRTLGEIRSLTPREIKVRARVNNDRFALLVLHGVQPLEDFSRA